MEKYGLDSKSIYARAKSMMVWGDEGMKEWRNEGMRRWGTSVNAWIFIFILFLILALILISSVGFISPPARRDRRGVRTSASAVWTGWFYLYKNDFFRFLSIVF
jgi:hypothetical protein